MTYMRQTVDNSKIVDLFARLTVLMSCSKATIIAVEDQVLPFLEHFVRHLAGALVHRYRLFSLDDLPEFLCLSCVL